MKQYNVITIRDSETWAMIEAMGTFERDCFTGEIWSFNGNEYYLSKDELDEEQKENLGV